MPYHLRYSLNRSQRLVPHLRIWGPVCTLYVVVLFGFFSIEAMASVVTRDAAGVAVFGVLSLSLLLLLRPLFAGLLDVILVASRSIDVVFEENAAGILCGGDRWYLFLDGLRAIRRYRDDVWTLEHFNGAVLHIPVAAITEDQLSHIRTAMERGRTPEGIKAVIERGKRIEAVLRSERKV